jgi:hypothetical protein
MYAIIYIFNFLVKIPPQESQLVGIYVSLFRYLLVMFRFELVTQWEILVFL